MPIQNSDVKLFESQRLTDEEDGGGRVTGREVASDTVNNLFQDISRIDRTIGDVSLRKAFIGVSTDNSDSYLGCHLIVTDAPQDENVSVLLFNSDSQTDERAAAKDQIEAYVLPSVKADFDFVGDQREGQRTLLAFQREEKAIPEIGDVYQIVSEDERHSQYVRITNVEHSIVTYTYSTGSSYIDFQRRQLELTVGTPLIALFPGNEPLPVMDGGSQIYKTQIADTARYYGIQPAKENIKAGSLTIHTENVYTPIVPSAKAETPLIDQTGNTVGRAMVACANNPRALTCEFIHINGNHSRTYLQRGALPNSLSLSISGGEYSDDGTGNLLHRAGNNDFSRLTVDYETGEVNIWRVSGYFEGASYADYIPAAIIQRPTATGKLEISPQNRGFSYTLNLADAKPRPGTLVVNYLALGKWQAIQDQGGGQLGGAGTGNISFATGTVSLTLDALPDPNSIIVYHYVVDESQEVQIVNGSVNAEKMTVKHQLDDEGILPNSVTVTYTVGDTVKTLSDAGNGLLQDDGGDAGNKGSIIYATGEIGLQFSRQPDDGTEIIISYECGELGRKEIPVIQDSSGVIRGTITSAPIKPGSVQLQLTVERESSAKGQDNIGVTRLLRTVNDDGAGGWQGYNGAIDYQSGEFTVSPLLNYTRYDYSLGTRTNMLGTFNYVITTPVPLIETFSGSTLGALSQTLSVDYAPKQASLATPELTIDLLPLEYETELLPNSIIVEWGGELFFDRDGRIYQGISTATNAGLQVGTIDYSGGKMILDKYPVGVSGVATILSAAKIGVSFNTSTVAFRTAGSPLRLASFQLTAVRADRDESSEIITASADLNGYIDTPEVQGKIDINSGWCEVQFLADGNSESPIFVIPSTIRYNAIVETTLPLDAELIGLDPVRLPPDGRVPIYRAGDVVVIRHTQETLIDTPSAGQVIALERHHQSEILIKDSGGLSLAAAQYSVDLEKGTLTLADPLNLVAEDGQALVGQLSVIDRVEHMSVVNDVQISGELSIIAPVPWDLPAKETTISSAVVYGDLQARVKNFYTQKVWDTGAPNWSDLPLGDQTTAQYNRINYPLICHNKGAIYGRWALIFTSATTFNIVEEKLGIIGESTTTVDTVPVNPENGSPYFVIKADGWGGGWAVGNAVRFNTDGCLAPVWMCRTVLSGQGTVAEDAFSLQIRGDAD